MAMTEKSFVAITFTGLLALCSVLPAEEQAKVDVLRIGTSGTLHPFKQDPKTEKAGLESLKAFIKEETGFDSEILAQNDWHELTEKMAKGDLHLGVFHGFEFAWAQGKHPNVKALAIAINGSRTPIACVVVQRDSPAKSFGDLKGFTVDLPDTGDRYLNLFVDHQCRAAGQSPEAFFSKISAQDNYEDSIDLVVDGKVQAAVVDHGALQSYQRRKPGRFNKLKEAATSQPFPPIVLAHFGSILDEPTLKRFKDGIMGASSKEKGQTLLTLFRVSAFEMPSPEFDKVVAETRKSYEPQLPAKK
jgi:phosphonate transport system substrate-binding protein